MRCAGVVWEVNPTDAWWTHAYPRTYHGGASPMCGFNKPTLRHFIATFGKSEKPSFCNLQPTFVFFAKVARSKDPVSHA